MNILNLPGGGVFGFGQAMVLSLLAKDVQWDCYAGTSVGGYNALMAATGQRDSACSLLEEHAKEVFAGRWWRRWKLISPRYPDDALCTELQLRLPMRFGNIKPKVVIPTDCVVEQRPKVFFSGDGDDGEWTAWEVARATMAAATMFEPWKGLSDGGGACLNDPVIAAATCLNDHLNIAYSDMDVTSIGTGLSSENMKQFNIHNPIAWGRHLINGAVGGSSVWAMRYFARHLGFHSYHHYEFQRPSGYDFDDPAVIPILKKRWADDVKRIAEKITADFSS